MKFHAGWSEFKRAVLRCNDFDLLGSNGVHDIYILVTFHRSEANDDLSNSDLKSF
jgi:hypothetical protein